MSFNFDHFYSQRLATHGSTAQGMGWKDERAQRARFEQLIKVIDSDVPFSINDLGCGSGDLLWILDEKNVSYQYYGYDIMKEMIHLAEFKHGSRQNATFTHIQEVQEITNNDYTVASGIFNIRFHIDDENWLKFILDTLTAMNEKSRRGFAFNMLTKYSDPPKMKEELYYGDPCLFFDYCKRKFSRNVALLHDYNEYDFTVLVRK